ncbi:ABC transporter [Enterococcus sp. LJL90]
MGKFFWYEALRELRELQNYRVNLIFANLSLVVLFWGFTNYFSSGNPNAMFFLLFAWYFATHSTTVPTFIIEDEINDRTIISLYQSKYSIERLVLWRCGVQIFVDTLKAIPLFVLLAFITKASLGDISIWSILSILFLDYLVIIGLYGLGIFFSSFTLFFSRTSSVVSLLSYYMLFFSGLTNERQLSPILKGIADLFPFQELNLLISSILQNQVPTRILLILLAKVVAYWLLGLLIFRGALKLAIKGGKLFGT